jgi:hypothetical protein
MPYGQIDGVGDEGAEGMDDDIAVAGGAIGYALILFWTYEGDCGQVFSAFWFSEA